jgi:hypothetical protein
LTDEHGQLAFHAGKLAEQAGLFGPVPDGPGGSRR